MSLSFGISDLFHGTTRLAESVVDLLADFGYAVVDNPAYLLFAGIVIALLAVALLRAR